MRKNSHSRARASKLKTRVAEIEAKPENERTLEEKEILASFEHKRQRKNNRSRERSLEKKAEIERILAKPENKRSKVENDFLLTMMSCKQRKNHMDRIRRQRVKMAKRDEHTSEEQSAVEKEQEWQPQQDLNMPLSQVPWSGGSM